jgi:hypothetical protein
MGRPRPAPPGTTHGFVREPGGRITTIDLPRFTDTTVTDINNRGQIAGVARQPLGAGPVEPIDPVPKDTVATLAAGAHMGVVP